MSIISRIASAVATPPSAPAAPTAPATPNPATPATAAAPGGAMGKDQFLQLLVAQMRNQDPTSPMDGTQMAAQLAQFSTVEQLQTANTTLTQIAGGLKVAGGTSSASSTTGA